MGYNPIFNKDTQNLHGYQGDKREQKAHIVIPKDQVGYASNDVGFERMPNGEYIAHISEYDKKTNWGEEKLNKLKQLYSKHVVYNKVKGNKYSLDNESTEENGTIKISIRQNY